MKVHLLDFDVLDVEVVVSGAEVGVTETNPPPVKFFCHFLAKLLLWSQLLPGVQ